MLRTVLITLILALLSSAPVIAGPGHDHDTGSPSATGAGLPRLEATGATLELVATADGPKLTVYLDRVDTNAPVDGATIEIARDGLPALTAVRLAPGTYAVESAWFEEPGLKPLVFTVLAGDDADLLNATLTIPAPGAAGAASAPSVAELLSHKSGWALIGAGLALGAVLSLLLRPRRSGPLVILAVLAMGLLVTGPVPSQAHEGEDHAEEAAASPVPSGTVPRRLPDGSVFLPKPTQRLLDVRTLPVKTERAPRTTAAIGSVIPDPSAFGRVQAPMDGIIDLGQRGLSFVGQKVEAGAVLARLSPTIPPADLGTMQQLRAEVAGKLKVAEQKLSRLSRISSVVAQSDIDDTRVELEALREQKSVLEPKDVQKFDLVAPVAGVISLANVRAGQVVTARDTLFEIVEPDRLWVEASGTDTHTEDDIVGGVARDADGHSIPLSYIGRSPVLRQQSQSLLFRIEQEHTGLAAGAPVTVIVERRESDTGIVLPDAAVVRGSSGLSQVWVKTGPERFRPAVVRTRPLDGSRVLVEAGLAEGDRVVVRAAELVNQIR